MFVGINHSRILGVAGLASLDYCAANEFGTTGWWWLIPLPVIFIETALFCWWFSLPERRNQ